jgi:thioredoxin 1
MIKVIKFSKNGCRPCSILSNVLTEVDFFSNNAELVEINISDQPEYIEQYDLSSVPVLVFEKEGKEVARINGSTDADTIIEVLRSLY